MKRFKRLTVLILACSVYASPLWAATYKVDKDHSSVSFKIKHLFSNVQGQFKDFEGSIDYDPDKPETWSAQGTVQTASIDTGSEKRDQHLKSADFFDAEKYPVITFKTTKVSDATKDSAKVEGVFAMHGVEKPMVLDAQIHGVGNDPWGNTRAGFTATTTINRKDFGIEWNQTLDNGGVLLGDEVMVTLEIEGILTKETTNAG